jgi:hypothetical protein
MNMIQEVGNRHFFDRWAGCMFYDKDGKPNYIRGQAPDGVIVGVIKGTASKPSMEEKILPNDMFQKLTMFKVPPLGWRATAEGRYMAFFNRNNKAYRRGVGASSLQRWISPATQYLINTKNISKEFYDKEIATVALIMMPEYHSLQDGLRLMRSGDLFSFAVSANLAVIPDKDEGKALYFNTNKVGQIMKDGTLNCSLPLISTFIRGQM